MFASTEQSQITTKEAASASAAAACVPNPWLGLSPCVELHASVRQRRGGCSVVRSVAAVAAAQDADKMSTTVSVKLKSQTGAAAAAVVLATCVCRMPCAVCVTTVPHQW